MDKVAFVFAGQGAQAPGMGADLYAGCEIVRPVMDRAEALRPGTLKMCFEGPADALADTINAQPCLFLIDYVCALAAGQFIKPDACAGFSLGEMAAAAYSGLLAFEEAFHLVIRRAEMMQACARRHPGAMFAVVKLSAQQVVEICRSIPNAHPVNFNGPGQTVVACAQGCADDLQRAVRGAGGRAIKLRLSGAFHSPFMEEASRGMELALKGANFLPPAVSIYANLTAQPYAAGQEAQTMARQIASPVRWQQTIENMIRAGVGTFVELGPGGVLSGLIKKIEPQAATYCVSDMEGLGALRRRAT
jgi:[acyl-carrier-protein] S-malonyltransferase